MAKGTNRVCIKKVWWKTYCLLQSTVSPQQLSVSLVMNSKFKSIYCSSSRLCTSYAVQFSVKCVKNIWLIFQMIRQSSISQN